MMGASKRIRFVWFAALILCIAVMASGCSASEETDLPADAETNSIEENAAEYTDAVDSTPGVYAELWQYDKTIEIVPLPGGITDSTILPTFKCTFGEMTNEAQNALEEGRIFPREFFRDLTACMLVSEESMAGKEHDAIMYSLSTLAAMANEFGPLDPVLENVVYELGDDGSVARSIYNVKVGSAGQDGQIIYDNRARKWYLGGAEYSGSIDDEETLAIWWTIFDIADGNIK